VEDNNKKKLKFKYYIQLHSAILIYTFSSVFSKRTADSLNENGLYSISTLVFFVLLFVSLGVYAIVWQQIIKEIDLTVAYVNKGVTIIWALFWSVIFFKETLSINAVIGACVVIAGIMVVNYEK